MNYSCCRLCGKKINIHLRKDTLFCSDLCKARHFDISKRPNHNQKAFLSFKAVVEKEKERSDINEELPV